MKVLFLPWNEKNPYQQNLADGLARLGVKVVGCRPGRFLPILGSLLRNRRPDVLHLHWISGYIISRFRAWTLAGSALFLLELLVVRTLGVRIVWTVHNLVEHKQRSVRYERWVASHAARLCDAMIVHCESGREAVARAFRLDIGDPKLAVVPHGNYLQNYPSVIGRRETRSKLGLTSSSFVYLFFGMVSRYKGIEELLDVFQEREDPAARLLIVGETKHAALGERITRAANADPRIVPVLRRVDDDEVQDFMTAADAVVLPFSDVFTSGSAVLAMGFGRPLVVPRIGCLPEYVDARGGIVYEPGRTGLADALRAIAVADREDMGRHNRTIAERLDWGDLARATRNVYLGASDRESPGSVLSLRDITHPEAPRPDGAQDHGRAEPTRIPFGGNATGEREPSQALSLSPDHRSG